LGNIFARGNQHLKNLDDVISMKTVTLTACVLLAFSPSIPSSAETKIARNETKNLAPAHDPARLIDPATKLPPCTDNQMQSPNVHFILRVKPSGGTDLVTAERSYYYRDHPNVTYVASSGTSPGHAHSPFDIDLNMDSSNPIVEIHILKDSGWHFSGSNFGVTSFDPNRIFCLALQTPYEVEIRAMRPPASGSTATYSSFNINIVIPVVPESLPQIWVPITIDPEVKNNG